MHVIVVWEPMLAGDSRDTIDTALFADRRTTVFWDPRRISGTWLGEQKLGGLDDKVVWDAYYAFPSSARWRIRPDHVLAAGSPIIGATDALQNDFVPLLGSSRRR
jgi:hypothetical protein